MVIHVQLIHTHNQHISSIEYILYMWQIWNCFVFVGEFVFTISKKIIIVNVSVSFFSQEKYKLSSDEKSDVDPIHRAVSKAKNV